MDIKDKDTVNSMESSSPSPKKKYPRKFQTKWLSDTRFASWIVPCEENENDAFCTLCNRKLSGSVTMLERHRKTKKHVKKLMNDDSFAAHDVFPQFFAKVKKIKTDEDEEGGKDNYTGEEEYEVPRTANAPGDHNTYIISAPSTHPSSIDKKNDKLYKDTINAANFLHQTLASRQDDDEFDHFGRSIASQLRKLPEESAVSLISELQCIITQRRLKVIQDRESQTPSITSQVLTVSLEDNQSYTS